MQALNLTDAQKQQAKEIFAKSRQAAVPLRQELRANREAMAQAVKATPAWTSVNSVWREAG